MVKIVFFSIYRDVVDKTIELSFENKITLRELVSIITKQYPDLNTLFNLVKPIILVNGVVANPDTVLNDGDEVAFIPPVSGG